MIIIRDYGHIQKIQDQIQDNCKTTHHTKIISPDADIKKTAQEATPNEPIIVLNSTSKLQPKSLDILADQLQANTIISPTVYELNLPLWMIEPVRTEHITLSQNLDLDLGAGPIYYTDQSHQSLLYNHHCFALQKRLLDTLDATTDTELALQNLALGGSNLIQATSIIGSSTVIPLIENKSELLGTYLRKYSDLFNIEASKPSRKDRQAANLDQLLRAPITCSRLKREFAGKSVAIVCPNHSLDFVPLQTIYSHDIVVAVDFVAAHVECDYLITQDLEVLLDSSIKKNCSGLLLPDTVYDHKHYKVIDPAKYTDFVFSVSRAGSVVNSLPIHEFRNSSLIALSFIATCGPAQITTYGLDFSPRGELTHSSQIRYYNGGKFWGNNSSQLFAYQQQFVELIKSQCEVPILLVQL